MPLFTPLRSAAGVFRTVKALTSVLLQPSLPSIWFSGTIGIAVLHRPVSCSCSGSLHAGLVREAVAAVFIEESYPLTRCSRKMKSCVTGMPTGLWWCFWFLKSYVPIIFTILNRFQKMKRVGLFTAHSDCFWKMSPNCTLSRCCEASEGIFNLSSRQKNKNINLHSFQEQSLRPVL